MKSILVGYKRFVSKKNNKTYCTAAVLSDLTEREKMSGMVGQKMEDLFLPEDYIEYLKPEDIGKEIFMNYEVSNGRAQLVSLSVAGREKK